MVLFAYYLEVLDCRFFKVYLDHDLACLSEVSFDYCSLLLFVKEWVVDNKSLYFYKNLDNKQNLNTFYF